MKSLFAPKPPKLIALLSLILVTGCGTPKSSNSTFKFQIGNQTIESSSPKDYVFKGLDVEIPTTNGIIKFKIAQLSSQVTTNIGANDTAAGNAVAAQITATGDAIEKNIKATGDLAKQAAAMASTGGASALTNK